MTQAYGKVCPLILYKRYEGKLNYLKKLFSSSLLASHWLNDRAPLALLFGAASLINIVVLGQFLFGNKLLLFSDIGSDTYYSYYAFYYFITNNLSNLQLPLWSFQLGAGTSVISLYQFLYDPFSIIYYLGGVENLSCLIAWVFALKTLCAAVFAYLYMRYLGLGPYVRIAMSLLFAFNGFLMVWGQHYFFATWVIFLPLLLYTIEVWFKTDKWLPMALCISFMALNIAIFFQVTVFCALYLLFKLMITRGAYSTRQLGVKILKFGGIYTLGLGLSAVLWLPEYYLLKSSPRISVDIFHTITDVISNFTQINTPGYYWSLIARIFSNNLQGVGSEYTGFLNYYESIQLYAGVLPLLLLPQLYCVFSSRAKWAASCGLLVIAIFLVFPGFSQIMNGFQYPSYRWGYNVIMFELLLAAIILDSMIKQRIINLPILIATGFLLFICLASLNLNGNVFDFASYKNNVIKTFEIITLIVCYSIALYFIITTKSRRLAFFSILILLCGELILEHYDSFNKRNVFTKGIEQNRDINFFDSGYQAVRQLKTTDLSFYRIEKNHWILSLNDSLIQNYFGLDSYNSLNNPSYLNVMNEFGHAGRLTVLKWNSLEHPYLADILSVKYHLTKTTNQLPSDTTYKGKLGDVSIYERHSYLPFGFTYATYMTPSMFNRLTTEDRERSLLQGAVLEDKRASKILTEVQQIASSQEDHNFRKNLRKEVLNITKMDGDEIVGSIRLERGKLLFLSIPFDLGWTAYVNGEKTELLKVNLGFTGLYLEQGDSIVELRYTPPYMKAGATISLLCLLMVIVLRLRSKEQSFSVS